MTTDNQDATTDEPNSLHGTMKSRMVAERIVSKIPIHILKSCLSHDVNESAAYFGEYPELKFDGCNSKRAVVSAFKSPDTWLKSWCIKARKQELCDVVNDAEKIAMLEWSCPATDGSLPDNEEETLKSDEEPAIKLKINEACTLLRVVTTGKTQRFIQDTDAPLHDESVMQCEISSWTR